MKLDRKIIKMAFLARKLIPISTGTKSSPVKMLKTFLNKTDTAATRLFNQCIKEAIHSPQQQSVWYSAKSLGVSTFRNFLPDICKQSGCSKRYTSHCLRATAIQAMSDEGFKTRQIMYMSGHRNEASIRSYNKDYSSDQKQSISSDLSSVASGQNHAVMSVETRSNLPRLELTSVPSVNPPNQSMGVSNSLMSSIQKCITN